MTFSPTNQHGRPGDVNILNESTWLKRLARSSVKAVPFAAAGLVLGSWLVYPALTPEFKGRWGLGPKIEEE